MKSNPFKNVTFIIVLGVGAGVFAMEGDPVEQDPKNQLVSACTELCAANGFNPAQVALIQESIQLYFDPNDAGNRAFMDQCKEQIQGACMIIAKQRQVCEAIAAADSSIQCERAVQLECSDERDEVDGKLEEQGKAHDACMVLLGKARDEARTNAQNAAKLLAKEIPFIRSYVARLLMRGMKVAHPVLAVPGTLAYRSDLIFDRCGGVLSALYNFLPPAPLSTAQCMTTTREVGAFAYPLVAMGSVLVACRYLSHFASGMQAAIEAEEKAEAAIRTAQHDNDKVKADLAKQKTELKDKADASRAAQEQAEEDRRLAEVARGQLEKAKQNGLKGLFDQNAQQALLQLEALKAVTNIEVARSIGLPAIKIIATSTVGQLVIEQDQLAMISNGDDSGTSKVSLLDNK
jgi:hypothetical protein